MRSRGTGTPCPRRVWEDLELDDATPHDVQHDVDVPQRAWTSLGVDGEVVVPSVVGQLGHPFRWDRQRISLQPHRGAAAAAGSGDECGVDLLAQSRFTDERGDLPEDPGFLLIQRSGGSEFLPDGIRDAQRMEIGQV